MQFRKKPVVIEAVQVTEDAAFALYEFIDDSPDVDVVRGHVLSDIADKVICVHVRTLEGVMIGHLGDWIIRGVKGEFYPCKPDIFDATYELAAAGAPVSPAPQSPQLAALLTDYPQNYIDAMNEERWQEACSILIAKIDQLYRTRPAECPEARQ